MAKKPTSDQTERRIHVLPIELLERIRKYQEDNNISSEVEAVRRLLNEALQSRDTIENILNQLDAAFEKEKDLRILARDILSTHVLVSNINIDENSLCFKLKNGIKGEIDRKGQLFKNDDLDNYNDNMESYTPPQKRQNKGNWDTSITPNNDLDDEIPF